jgi:RimJ/RimL family protein N-acetyltransferase
MNLRALLQCGARVILVRRKIVYEADFDELHKADARLLVQFRSGTAVDLSRLSKDEHSYDASALEFGAERLRAGDRLTLGEAGNEIAFYGWRMRGQFDTGVRQYLPLAPDAAYLYRLFTVAKYRGRGLTPAHFWYVREQLSDQGVRRLVSWVEARNVVSCRVHEKSGFRRIGSIWHIQFLFRTYSFVPTALKARLKNPIAQAVAGTAKVSLPTR